MSNAHTPGPWSLHIVPTSVGFCFKVGPFPWKDGRQNHACIYADYPGANQITNTELGANARLIAAAPDLLEALQTIVNSAEANQAAILYPLIDDARAAIAKATGEQ